MEEKPPHHEKRITYFTEKIYNNEAWRNWELKAHNSNQWMSLNNDPFFYKENEYRRKLDYVEINGIKVPKPYFGVPNIG